MKLLVSSVLLLAIAGAAFGYSATWGVYKRSDTLLYRDVIERDAREEVWNVQVDFPENGDTNKQIISAVFVYDYFYNCSGAIPNLVSGGPGYIFTSVSLQSVPGEGMNSKVEVWGR